MKHLLHLIILKVLCLIAKIDPKRPATFELDPDKMHRKGSGAESFRTEAKMALRCLTGNGIKSPVVLDIGANVGRYSESILDLNPRSKFCAFEPSTAALSKLKRDLI